MNDQNPPSRDSGGNAWFERPENTKRIVWAIAGLSVLLFLADALYHKHPYFDIEKTFGFYGVYGFIACAVLVFGAKGLRGLLMRSEDYYDDGKDDA